MSSSVLGFFLAAATVGSVPAAGPPEGVFEPPPIVKHQLEEGASKRAAYEEFQRTHGTGTKNWASELPPPTYDVRGYDIDVFVDPARHVLSGTVTMTFAAVVDGLATVTLDADLGLRVLSVLQIGEQRFPYDTPAELAFEHEDDRLTVTLAQPVPAGTAVKLQVTYGGHAMRGGLIGTTGVNWYSNGGTPVIHTFAQPFGARVWWPCNDRPDDKATVSLRVTVPGDLDVASNGLERSRVDNGDGTATSVWSSIYPVPTYLVVMHISEFVYSEATYTGLDGTTMPVSLWAMPQVAAQAEADLAVTVPQIEVMAGYWGEYPFIEEKYGNATVFFGGGMEHQTMTTLSVYRVGDPWMQWLNVHELGHQWWGDWVTMDDWRHIWLNEGYATHTEWLWAEHLGPDVLAQYLEDDDYLGQFRGPVYDNPEPFSWTIYAKGSWVVWMLRHVVGDEAFFDAMAAYRAEHAGGTATTDDLQAAMEDAGGMELDWFFDQWVYGLYRPRYVYSWSNVGGSNLELTVRQEQTNTGLFRMPMDVRVTTSEGVEDHRVWFEAEAEQMISIPLQADAENVEIDPNTRVLCEIAHVSQPDLELGPGFPDGYDFGLIAGTGHATRILPLTNVGGVDLVVEGVWPEDGGSFSLNDPPEFPLTIAPGETRSVELIFDPAGYGTKTDWFYIQSNDPDREGGAYLRVTGIGTLYDDALLAAPASATVGRVPVGGTAETAFAALNLGGQPLAVTTTVEGEGFFLAEVVPTVFEPGVSNEVRIRFSPTEIGTTTGSVIFHTGDPGQPLKTVRLTATGEGAPRLEIDPVALSLGIGDGSVTATISIANTGTEGLVITVVEADSPFALAEFKDVFRSIPPGVSRILTIGLEDPPLGTLDGHLTIHSNDPSVPVARVPLRAHVSENPVDEASFTAAASGPGLGDTRWSSRAFLLNPTDEALQTDLIFRPGIARESDGPDAGFEVPARSQRVIPNLVRATGASGSGGVNLRTSGTGLVAVSRTFASGADGSYGQFIAAQGHRDALDGNTRALLAGLSGNGGFHTNIGVLNLGADPLSVDYRFFNTAGELLGTRQVHAQPGAFAQVVSVISKLTGEVVVGGYATFAAADADALYLAYASVVDDASHDPTLVVPQVLDAASTSVDLVVPAVAAIPGAGGTSWRSQLDVVNTTGETRSVNMEFTRADGTAITSMPMELQGAETLHFDDVVGGLFGETGKGWLRVTSSDPGVHAASRTYNDDADGTYGQLIPASSMETSATSASAVILPGLSSEPGFRTNLGFTSVSAVATTLTVTVYSNTGSPLGEIDVALPAQGFIQVERALSEVVGFTGTAWAEVRSEGPYARYFAHASVVDEATGDPTYIPGMVP